MLTRKSRIALAILGGLLLIGCENSSPSGENIYNVTAQPISRPVEFSMAEMGELALERREYTVARYYLERAVALEPDNIESWYKLGLVEYQLENGDAAIAALENAAYKHAAQNDSIAMDALLKLAEVTTRYDQLEKSRLAFELALKKETRESQLLWVRNQLAELDLTEGKPVDDGNYIFNKNGEVIGGVGPGDMRTNRNFEIARHTQDVRKKEMYFKKAIESDPGMHQSYFNVGLALVQQERFAEAIPYFELSNKVWQERTDINPEGKEKASAYAFLGYCATKTGDAARGLQLCEKALQLDQGYFYAHLYRAHSLLALNRVSEATDILRKLLTENPDDSEVFALLKHASQ